MVFNYKSMFVSRNLIKITKKLFSNSIYFKSQKKQKLFEQRTPKKEDFSPFSQEKKISQNFVEFMENFETNPLTPDLEKYKKLSYLLKNDKLKKSYKNNYLKEKEDLLLNFTSENLKNIRLPFIFENEEINIIEENLKKELLDEIEEKEINEIIQNKVHLYFENINNIENFKSSSENYFFTYIKSIKEFLTELEVEIKFNFKEEEFVNSQFLGNTNYLLIDCNKNRKKNLPENFYFQKPIKIDDKDFIWIKKKKLSKNPKAVFLSRNFFEIKLNFEVIILDKNKKIIFSKVENFNKKHLVVSENIFADFEYRKFKKNSDNTLFFFTQANKYSVDDMYIIDCDNIIKGNQFFKSYRI